MRIHVNRYDGFWSSLFGLRYQAHELDRDDYVYARSYRRVLAKAARRWMRTPPDGEPTGNHGQISLGEVRTVVLSRDEILAGILAELSAKHASGTA